MRFLVYCALDFYLVIMAKKMPVFSDGLLYAKWAEDIYHGIAVPHNRFMVPWLINLFYRLTGGINDVAVKMTGPAFYLLGFIVLVEDLTRRFGERKALIAGFLFLTMVLLLYHARNVYTDLPLAVLVMIGGLFALRWWEERRIIWLAAALAPMVAGIFTKNSGLPLFTVFVLVIILKEVVCLSKRFAPSMTSLLRR